MPPLVSGATWRAARSIWPSKKGQPIPEGWAIDAQGAPTTDAAAAFQPLPEFGARMERMIEELKAVPLAVGHDEIFYPGEMEARNEARHRREGLMLPPDTIRDLEKVAAECSLPPPTAP